MPVICKTGWSVLRWSKLCGEGCREQHGPHGLDDYSARIALLQS
jgi:hypothetical protein